MLNKWNNYRKVTKYILKILNFCSQYLVALFVSLQRRSGISRKLMLFGMEKVRNTWAKLLSCNFSFFWIIWIILFLIYFIINLPFQQHFSHIWEKCFWHLLSVICIWKKRIGARGHRVEVTDLKDVTGCLIGHRLSECPVWNVWLKITTHPDTHTRLEQFIFLTISQFQCNSF